MARYKPTGTDLRLLAVDLRVQLVPGTFEHALDELLGGQLDLSAFDTLYRNDECGASAYAPAVLLKAILLGYSRGFLSSRSIERACRENILFMALTRDAAPHFSTIAGFLGAAGEKIPALFAQVLYLCGQHGLIGRELFAIDGVKLPANASKARSGTRADFEHQAAKLEAAVTRMLADHQRHDAEGTEDLVGVKKAERLAREAQKLRTWLADHPQDRRGTKGAIRKSNRTDNESAKMATSKGVIQGYCGVAAVDARHQIVLEAQAHGTGSEQELLMPVLEAMAEQMAPDTLITADAGYHSESNLTALETQKRPALIADTRMRQRDERLAGQEKHKAKPDPLHDKSAQPEHKPEQLGSDRFLYDAEARTCRCPAGHLLTRSGTYRDDKGLVGNRFRGRDAQCGACPLKTQCLRDPDKARGRQVTFFSGKDPAFESATERMRRLIDSPRGRALYGRRLATVEPVFANLRHNKRQTRFTLRGRRKVDTQWKLYCMVHNIEKLAHFGSIGKVQENKR